MITLFQSTIRQIIRQYSTIKPVTLIKMSLNDFLSNCKQNFLDTYDKSNINNKFTFIIGNQSADLDSIGKFIYKHNLYLLYDYLKMFSFQYQPLHMLIIKVNWKQKKFICQLLI